jgi:Co/Zn/Cd efflux system component
MDENDTKVQENEEFQHKGDLRKLREPIPAVKTSTMISKMERELIQKIKNKKIESQKNAIRKLVIVSVICIFFMIVELVGNYLSGSLAILSDALHMLSDFSGFAISMASMIISRKKPSQTLSFGYYRAEVVGALLSVFMIWCLTAWLVYEAVQRCMGKEVDLNPKIMLIVAIIGLICNIIMGHTLHSVVRIMFNI